MADGEIDGSHREISFIKYTPTKEEITDLKSVPETLYRGPAKILALKYNLKEEEVFDILCLENGWGILFKDINTLYEKSYNATGERIPQYAKYYNIPQVIVSSLLMDYENNAY